MIGDVRRFPKLPLMKSTLLNRLESYPDKNNDMLPEWLGRCLNFACCCGLYFWGETKLIWLIFLQILVAMSQGQNKICSQIKKKVETNVSQFYWTAMPSLTGPSGWWVVMRTNGVEFSWAPTWLMVSNLKRHFPLPAKRRGRKGRRRKSESYPD